MLRQLDYYEPFAGEALTLDAVRGADENIEAAMAYVESIRSKS